SERTRAMQDPPRRRSRPQVQDTSQTSQARAGYDRTFRWRPFVTEIRFESQQVADPLEVKTDFLILPVAEGELESATIRKIDRKLAAALSRHAKEADFRAQEGKSLLHRVEEGAPFRTLYLSGMGKTGDRTLGRWRRAGA